MTNPPNLGPRAINAYNRFARELAAFNYALRVARPAGAVSDNTIFILNGLIIVANRLFRRHRDLPRFFGVSLKGQMSQADLTIYVARLTAASIHFEERYHHLTEEGRAAAAAKAPAPPPPVVNLYQAEGLPSPHG